MLDQVEDTTPDRSFRAFVRIMRLRLLILPGISTPFLMHHSLSVIALAFVGILVFYMGPGFWAWRLWGVDDEGNRVRPKRR